MVIYTQTSLTHCQTFINFVYPIIPGKQTLVQCLNATNKASITTFIHSPVKTLKVLDMYVPNSKQNNVVFSFCLRSCTKRICKRRRIEISHITCVHLFAPFLVKSSITNARFCRILACDYPQQIW